MDDDRRAPRILLVRLSALGDVVYVLPALAALRAALPRATIGFAIEPKSASILEAHPQIDRLHVIPRVRLAADFFVAAGRAARKLRRMRYDVAIDFQSNLRSSIVTRLAGAKRVIGQPPEFAKELSQLLEREHPRALAPDSHKIDRNLAMLEPLGIEPPRAPRPVLAEPARSREIVRAFLRGARRPLVLIHPGVSARWPTKRWREEGFVAVARRLAALGARVVVSYGGPGERALAARIVAAAGGGVELAPDLAPILDFAALVRRADVFIAVDTGPLHLAAALGTPCVALYGPTDPRIYGPYWENGVPVRKGVACSPCRVRDCPRNECMSLITADEVLEAVDAMLATASAREPVEA